MEYKPEDSLMSSPKPPAYQTSYSSQAHNQAPAYNVLPNGQVQMIYTMPAGFVPPGQQYPYPGQPTYGQQVPQPSFQYPNEVHYEEGRHEVEIYPTPMPPQYVYQQGPAPTSDNGLYLGALITYIVGMFTFLPYFISLVLTFVMVNKNLVQGGRKSVVLAMAIIELIAWMFCVAFSWFGTQDCYYDGYSYDCYYMWWGWIGIVIWFAVGLACGIPRVVFLKQQSTQYYHQN